MKEIGAFEWSLVIINVVFFGVSFVSLLKKNRIIAFFYFCLYIFAFPLLLVYGSFREILISIKYVSYWKLPFDMKTWYKYYFHVFLSMWLLYVMFRFYLNRNKKKIKEILNYKYYLGLLGKIFLTSYFIVELYLIFRYNKYINYYTRNQEKFNLENPAFGILSLLINYSIIVIILLKSIEKKLEKKEMKFVSFLKILYLILFFYFSLKSGDKSNLFSLLLVYLVMSMKNIKINMKKTFKIGIGIFAIYIFVLYVGEKTRIATSEYSSIFLKFFFNKALCATAIPLLAVIKFNYINPLEVITSNILKSIIFIPYHYLYMTIGPMFSYGIFDNSHSFGWTPITEGYMFAGIFGFIYNGLVFGYLTILWDKLINKSNDEVLNTFLMGVCVNIILPVTRGSGSVWYIRYLYLNLLPAYILYKIIIKRKAL